MNIAHTEDDAPPSGVRRPKSLREARKRLSKIKSDMKDIEMQLADPNVTDRDGKRLAKRRWEDWRSKALHALRRKQQELGYLNAWVLDARLAVRAQEVGVSPSSDPNTYLAEAVRLFREVRKSEALDKELHMKVGKLADSIEQYLTFDAEVV